MKRLWIVPFGLVFAAMIWLVIAILPDIKRYMRMHEMYRRGNIQHTPVSAVRLTDLPRAFRTADLWLIHAADCCSRYSSKTCCGVRY